MTTFYRLLKDTDKAVALRSAVAGRRSGDTDSERTFTVDPAAFSKVPNTPFAYWVDDEIRDLFVKLPPFESEGRTVRVGLQTSDDFRFVRAWWEVDPARRLDPGLAGAPDWREDLEGFQAWCRRRTHEGKGWAPFAKGGEYSPYYSDIHLVVNWEREGEEMKAFAGSVIRNPDYYFRPGVTWPGSTVKGFNARPLPAGCVFSHKGMSAFVRAEESSSLLYWLGLFNSMWFQQLVYMQNGSRAWEAGLVQNIPAPEATQRSERISGLSRHALVQIAVVLATSPMTLLFSLTHQDYSEREVQYRKSAVQVEELAYRLWLKKKLNTIDNAEHEFGFSLIKDLDHAAFEIPAPGLSVIVDCVYGRWDLRFRNENDLLPRGVGTFHSLPVVPPATLVGPDGLPATSGHIVSEEWLQARPNAITLPPAGTVTTSTIADDEYPIPIPWDGILVDDPDHPADIVARIRQVLTVLHGEGAQQAEEELCAELAVDTLREYIADPKGFFADHLSRYSKSRRKAPIYWPLSTPSGGWTAWIYYPRLTDATIYTLIERYLHPRLELARQLYEEVARIPAASRSPGQQRQFDLSSRDKDELAAMEEELKRIAAMPYRVNHDDGVPILAAPFAGMFRHREWAKYLTGIWEKLEAGEYDWAHLAYAIWPTRVREKARDDRSIAIAHGIEEAQ